MGVSFYCMFVQKLAELSCFRSEQLNDHVKRGSLFIHSSPVLECLLQVVFKALYPKDYTSAVSTRVSNALLIGQYM